MQEAKIKEEEERAKQQESQQVRHRPHIVNLNEDPMLDRKIVYDLTSAPQTHIGRRNGDPVPQVVLGGIGIQSNHAFFELSPDGSYLLKPSSAIAFDQITVNGNKLTNAQGVKLQPNDRIIFGTNSVFLFKDPEHEMNVSMVDQEENPISWELAHGEKSALEDKEAKKAQEEQAKKQEAEAQAKLQELESKMEEEKR